MFLTLVLLATSEEFLAVVGSILILGSITALFVGIISIILGYKSARKPKTNQKEVQPPFLFKKIKKYY
ncbi:MAG: hypothetical protein FGF52_00065 [Candidatus Brockarchaeota archaeon]|nr:hypothetical protein [Candidatus Brockarchaeota archaeon]